MPDRQYDLKQQLFSAKTLYRELHQDKRELNSGQSLLFNDLVQLAQGNPQIDVQRVMQQVNQSLPWRRQYMQLLQKLAFATSPVQAAASSTTAISSRQSAEFELLFKHDKQFSGQVYVVLKIPHALDKHFNQGVIINCCGEKVISSVNFPPIVDGKTQLLMEESDQKFINMFDAEFAIYLS